MSEYLRNSLAFIQMDEVEREQLLKDSIRELLEN